jgi:dynein heavy chain
MLDPVLEKQIVRKGKTLFINVSDQYLEYNPKFSLFFISRLPNPHFSPELQAKTTVIDFTVTMKGLEEQLLGRVSQGLKSTCNRPITVQNDLIHSINSIHCHFSQVISKEQSALEEQLTGVIATVTSNTKSLQLLDQQLLDRLTSNTGSLLDDPGKDDGRRKEEEGRKKEGRKKKEERRKKEGRKKEERRKKEEGRRKEEVVVVNVQFSMIGAMIGAMIVTMIVSLPLCHYLFVSLCV